MHTIIKDRMIHPAKLYSFIGRDGAGDETFADPADIKGFLWNITTVVRNIKGEDVTSQRRFIIDLDQYTIRNCDELLLDGTRIAIQSIGTYEPYVGQTYQLGVLYL